MRRELIILLSAAAVVVAGLGLRSKILQKGEELAQFSNQIDQIIAEDISALNVVKNDDTKLAVNDAAENSGSFVQNKETFLNDKEEILLQEEYKKEVLSLAKEIHKANLDIDKLNVLASNLSFDEFLTHIPQNMQEQYRRFHSVIIKMQKLHMKQDGMPLEFFGRYQVTPPAWIKNRSEELGKMSLPLDVENFIQTKLNETVLNDGDVQRVLELCGKGSRDCIEGAFVKLIDANHSLTDLQQSMVNKNL